MLETIIVAAACFAAGWIVGAADGQLERRRR